MLWVDSVLRLIAYGTSIMATLRAGSRAWYLSQNSAIGTVDGPLILPPSVDTSLNQTNSSLSSPSHPTLYEISEAFRHCVRLSLYPDDYQGVRRDVQEKKNDDTDDSEEPYYISPYHYRSNQVSQIAENGVNVTEEENNDGRGAESRLRENGPTIQTSHRMPTTMMKYFPKLSWGNPRLSAIRKIDWIKQSVAGSTGVASAWMKRFYFGRDEYEIDLENENEDVYGKSTCKYLIGLTRLNDPKIV